MIKIFINQKIGWSLTSILVVSILSNEFFGTSGCYILSTAVLVGIYTTLYYIAHLNTKDIIKKYSLIAALIFTIVILINTIKCFAN